MCPRAVQTLTRRMWTVSNFPSERLRALVRRSPAVQGNNVTTCAEQFVSYLQVHLRLCSGLLNHRLFISSSADLLEMPPNWLCRLFIPCSLVVFHCGGRGSHSWSSTQKSISIQRIWRSMPDSCVSCVSKCFDLFSEGIFTFQLWQNVKSTPAAF